MKTPQMLFDPTFPAREHRRVDTTTLAGLKQAERLHAQGWQQDLVTLFAVYYSRPVKSGNA